MFINIHSHHHAHKDEWVIKSLYRNFEETAEHGHYSLGLHPWHILTVNWIQAFTDLKQFSKSSSVLAIGECGLDKACDTNFRLQQEVFTVQVQWANEIKKPLIIHCVRAYEEVLSILKKYNNKVPVIFHGFNKNESIAAKILLNGHWLSFGKALLQDKMAAVFATLPLEKLFLETDDSDSTIEEIYIKAAGIKNISLEELNRQLNKNVQKVFNKEL